MSSKNELALVFGIDASGKSTFMKGLQTALGYTTLEPTSSNEAKAFKAENLDAPLTIELVDERQRIFLDLNKRFDAQITNELERNNVATSGSTLITNLSHAVMRRVIRHDKLFIPDIVGQWSESATITPDTIVLTHAPINVVEKRIIDRQNADMKGEQLLGFNSLYFLSRYQEALLDTYDILGNDFRTFTFDSSLSSPDTAINSFVSLKS